MTMGNAIEAYKKVKAHAVAEEGANQYRVVQMLMQGVLDKLFVAKAALKMGDTSNKGLNISLAISILDGLQSSLDANAGGELADNLFKLYQFMMETLLAANLHNSESKIDEVIDLMITIKSGWDGIEKEAEEFIANQPPKPNK